MDVLRPEIAALEQNGITRVALPRIGDPDVIALWFGEGDIVTEGFIRDAAKRALDDGDTFYTHTRGRQDLRDALKRYLDALYGIDLDPDRISVPGSTMLGITIAAQMVLGRGDHAIIVGPSWPNIESTYRTTGAEVDYVRQRRTDAGWRLDLDDIRARAPTAHPIAVRQHPLQPHRLGDAGGAAERAARAVPGAEHPADRGRGLPPQRVRRRRRAVVPERLPGTTIQSSS